MARTEKSAPADKAPAVTYDAVPVPESTRGDSNPHRDKVRELNDARVAGRPSAAAFLVPNGPDHDKRLAREVRYLQEAGAALGITVRKATKADDRGTMVTFWPVEKIVRKKSETSGAPVASVAG